MREKSSTVQALNVNQIDSCQVESHSLSRLYIFECELLAWSVRIIGVNSDFDTQLPHIVQIKKRVRLFADNGGNIRYLADYAVVMVVELEHGF